MATFEARAGDAFTFEVVLTRRDGTLQPLVGNETGTFVWSTWLGSDVLTKNLTVSDAPNSKVKVTGAAGDSTALKGQVLRVRVPVVGLETFPTSPDDLICCFY
jgi:hypothetical protein